MDNENIKPRIVSKGKVNEEINEEEVFLRMTLRQKDDTTGIGIACNDEIYKTLKEDAEFRYMVKHALEVFLDTVAGVV